MSRLTTGLNLLLFYVAAHFLVQLRTEALLCCESRHLNHITQMPTTFRFYFLNILAFQLLAT